MVLGNYLLLLSGDGEGWNRLLHGGSVEDEDDNFGVSIFINMMTWRLLFLDGSNKAEIMSPPWNNFLRSLLCFVVVRSDHDEGPVRINLPIKSITGIELGRFRLVFFILYWQKEEEGRHKNSTLPA